MSAMNEDDEVVAAIHSLLGAYMKDRRADAIIVDLREVMRDKEDGPELVRLMQKWMAVS